MDLRYALCDIYQQVVPVVLMEVIYPRGFGPVSSTFTVWDINTELMES